MTHDEMIAVIQACKEGKVIQHRQKGWKSWTDTLTPSWDFALREYRVKPEPREWWINVYPDDAKYVYCDVLAAQIGKGSRCVETVHIREVL